MNDKEAFKDAIENDEHAEYQLPSGDTLVTDHEDDGHFRPYVFPTADDRDDHATDEIQRVSDALADVETELGFRTNGVEWDSNNNVFHLITEVLE
jgi:hypothetical protein